MITSFIPYAHWFLRIAIASVFMYHGIDKFPKLEGVSEMLGMSVPAVFLLAAVETGGGLSMVLSGLMKDRLGDIGTRLAALALIPVMLGAIIMVHWGQWTFMATETHPMGGMEFQVTLLMTLLYMLVKGNKA